MDRIREVIVSVSRPNIESFGRNDHSSLQSGEELHQVAQLRLRQVLDEVLRHEARKDFLWVEVGPNPRGWSLQVQPIS